MEVDNKSGATGSEGEENCLDFYSAAVAFRPV